MSSTVILEDYTLTNYSSSMAQRSFTTATGDAATLVMIYVGAGADGHKITLTDADGLSKTYEFDNNSTVTGDNVAIDISDNTSDITFTNLKNAIEGASGHNGTITGVIDTTGGSGFSGILTLTQATKGQAGNKSATFTGTGYIKDDAPPAGFTGGTGGEAVIEVIPYRLSVRSVQNIRGQTTDSYYSTFLGEGRT